MSIELDNAMIHTILSSNNNHIIYLKKALLFLLQIPPLRYILQYILGQIMVFIRVSDGNLTYLLGNVTTESFKTYFPLSYLFKESILVILSLGIVFIYNLIFFIKKYILKSNIYQHKKTLYEILVLMVIIWYWVITLISNLNLGIRHILPILLLTYIWLGLSMVPLIKKLKLYSILFVGLIYYIFNTIIIYPNYLSYINPIGSLFGPAYNIFVDSNLDWGQDLKRLKLWIDENDVKEIYIDYFGGDNMYYYFEHNDSRVKPYAVDNGELKDTYLAVSTTQYHLKYKSKLNKDNQEYWILANKKPIKIIGGSILIFKL